MMLYSYLNLEYENVCDSIKYLAYSSGLANLESTKTDNWSFGRNQSVVQCQILRVQKQTGVEFIVRISSHYSYLNLKVQKHSPLRDGCHVYSYLNLESTKT